MDAHLSTELREPAVAGTFYPAEPGRLSDTVMRLLDGSGVTPAPERVIAGIVPHAAYVHSGATAARFYARIRGKRPTRVVVLGASHRLPLKNASVFDGTAFECPLGRFPVDTEFAKLLADRVGNEAPEAHVLEHGLEVQLPLLAESVGLAPIVPVLFGGLPTEWHGEFGQMLSESLDGNDLVVASTDLSHYLNEEEANEVDRKTLETIRSGDWRELNKGMASRTYAMCGAAAVTATMAYAEAAGADSWDLLDYRTSARTAGDWDRVVGYSAVAMERTQ